MGKLYPIKALSGSYSQLGVVNLMVMDLKSLICSLRRTPRYAWEMIQSTRDADF